MSMARGPSGFSLTTVDVQRFWRSDDTTMTNITEQRCDDEPTTDELITELRRVHEDFCVVLRLFISHPVVRSRIFRNPARVPPYQTTCITGSQI